MTSEHDLTEHLLDYYLAHGMKHIARRFRLKADIIIELLTEAGVDINAQARTEARAAWQRMTKLPYPADKKRSYTPNPKRRKYTAPWGSNRGAIHLPPPKPRGCNSVSGFTRLTDEQKAKLRAEYVPGKMLENKRLAEKYNTSTAWVSQLTADLRG